MGRRNSSPWLVKWSSDKPTDVRLVCFPHAGAGPAVYRGWARHLPDTIAVYAVHLPGRSSRLAEPPLTDLREMASRLAPEIRQWITPPLVFFGHSLGTVIAYETARLLAATSDRAPRLLVASGRTAPHLRSRARRTYDLPREEFVEGLGRAGGTPREVLESPEVLDVVLPMVRADLKAIDTYRHEEGKPLDCPILAIGGADDPHVNEAELQAWGEHTAGGFGFRVFPGGHFFLHENEEKVLTEITDAISDRVMS